MLLMLLSVLVLEFTTIPHMLMARLPFLAALHSVQHPFPTLLSATLIRCVRPHHRAWLRSPQRTPFDSTSSQFRVLAPLWSWSQAKLAPGCRSPRTCIASRVGKFWWVPHFSPPTIPHSGHLLTNPFHLRFRNLEFKEGVEFSPHSCRIPSLLSARREPTINSSALPCAHNPPLLQEFPFRLRPLSLNCAKFPAPAEISFSRPSFHFVPSVTFNPFPLPAKPSSQVLLPSIHQLPTSQPWLGFLFQQLHITPLSLSLAAALRFP